MAFGPRSNNPREMRSYAHTLINKSSKSGKPEDKLAAVEAGNVASVTQKGKGLGHQAVRAAINVNPERHKFYSPDDALPGGLKAWTSDIYVRRHRAVSEALGGSKGVTITKPETDAEYHEAALKIASTKIPLAVNVNQLAQNAISEQLSLEEVDWSVPGTVYQFDAVQAVARDSSWQPKE